jgi:hypothetical protein
VARVRELSEISEKSPALTGALERNSQAGAGDQTSTQGASTDDWTAGGRARPPVHPATDVDASSAAHGVPTPVHRLFDRYLATGQIDLEAFGEIASTASLAIEVRKGVLVGLDVHGDVRMAAFAAPDSRGSTPKVSLPTALLRAASRVHHRLAQAGQLPLQSDMWAFPDPHQATVGHPRVEFRCATCGSQPIGQFDDGSPSYACASGHPSAGTNLEH